MGTTTLRSLQRFRFRRAASEDGSNGESSLGGARLGIVTRRYGLMASEIAIDIDEVITESGDLAVADRLAFLVAMERSTVVVVVQADDTYYACTLAGSIDADFGGAFIPADSAPRLMSITSQSGIRPVLGPLACA